MPSTARVDTVHPRAWGRLGLVIAGLLVCLPLHGLWRGARRASPWPRRFLHWTGWASGIRVTRKGLPVHGAALYIANHVSWLDIPVLAGATGTAFVAKADMERWPLLGWLATLHNTVYVARDQRLDVHGQAQRMRAALATGQPLTLFPEGTTNDGRTLLPFRSSLVAVVTPPPDGVAIQPVAIHYGPDMPDIAWTGEEAVGANALRVLSRAGTLHVCLHFLPSLDHADFADRKAITAHSRDAIATALEAG